MALAYDIGEAIDVFDGGRDPAGLNDLRVLLHDEIGRRWKGVASRVKRAIVEGDALGVGDKSPRLYQPAQDKAVLFGRWFEEQLHSGIGEGSWLAPYIAETALRAQAQQQCAGTASRNGFGDAQALGSLTVHPLTYRERSASSFSSHLASGLGLRPIGEHCDALGPCPVAASRGEASEIRLSRRDSRAHTVPGARLNVHESSSELLGRTVTSQTSYVEGPSAETCYAATCAAWAGIRDAVSRGVVDSVTAGLVSSRGRASRIAALVDKALGRGLQRSRMLGEHALTQAYSQATLDAMEARGVTHVGTVTERKIRDAGYSPDEPREHGRWTTEFVSPSVAQHPGWEEAMAAPGERERRFAEASRDVDATLGIATDTQPVIGAWVDGAERSLMTTASGTDWDRAMLAAAMKGYLGDQKMVAVFQEGHPDSNAAMYSFKATGDLSAIHRNLLDDGISNHTLQPVEGGALVHVIDTEGGLEDAVGKAAGRYGTRFQYRKGRAEFPGADVQGTDRAQRDAARQAYGKIIAESPVRGAAEHWQNLHHRWAAALAHDAWLAFIDDAARKQAQARHPGTGRYARAHVALRERHRHKRTGRFQAYLPTKETVAAAEEAERRFAEVGLVGVETAGDDRVCDVCDSISASGPYTIGEARSLIPAHRNCRCVFTEAPPLRGMNDWLADYNELHQPAWGKRRKVGDYDPDEPRDPHGRWTSGPLRGHSGDPATISTALTTAKGVGKAEREQVIAESGNYQRIDLDRLRQDPEVFEGQVATFRNGKDFPYMRPGDFNGDTEHDARAVIDRIKSNLGAMWNDTTDDKKQLWRHWYVGAHDLVSDRLEQYKEFGLSRAAVTGMYAAMSPNTMWDVNVHLGDRMLETVYHHGHDPWDKGMADAAQSQLEGAEKALTKKGGNAVQAQRNLEGMRQTFKEVQEDGSFYGQRDLYHQAAWIKLWNDAHDTTSVREVGIDGKLGAPIKNKGLDDNGEPAELSGAFGPLDRIENALDALNSGGNPRVISDALGERHKVRSFYNNILDPHSANGDVTIDTHAAGAAWLAPLGSDAKVVQVMFKGAPTSARYGVQGAYPLYAEAFREFAQERGYEPREVQSIVWEHKIDLFKNAPKAKKQLVAQAWQRFHDNPNVTLEQTQHRVLQIAHAGYDLGARQKRAARLKRMKGDGLGDDWFDEAAWDSADAG